MMTTEAFGTAAHARLSQLAQPSVDGRIALGLPELPFSSHGDILCRSYHCRYENGQSAAATIARIAITAPSMCMASERGTAGSAFCRSSVRSGFAWRRLEEGKTVRVERRHRFVVHVVVGELEHFIFVGHAVAAR